MRMLTRRHHASEPIQRGMWVATPKTLVKSRDDIVVFFASFVVKMSLATEDFAYRFGRRVATCSFNSRSNRFKRIERSAGIALRSLGDEIQSLVINLQIGKPVFRIGNCAVQHLANMGRIEQIEHKNARA